MKIDTLHNRIDSCCQTNLKASGISPLRVLRWLENFEKEDWDYALSIAEHITYVSEQEIYAQYKFLLEQLFEKIDENDTIFLLPSKIQDIKTGIGKSSQLMTYYLKKVVEDLPQALRKRINFLANSKNGEKYKQDLKSDAVLVIFDDYVGSGQQLGNFISNTLLKLHGQYYSNLKSYFVLSLYILEDGESYLKLKLPKWNIISQTRKKAFSRRGSVFGYERKMKPIREFCHKYGKKFHVWEKDKAGNKKKICIATGYKNSQELITFCYRTPNNTIPIIWSSFNDWYPLFPRFANDIISEAKMFRKESAFLLHKSKLIFKKENSLISGLVEEEGKINKFITQRDVLLLCVMRLQTMGANLASICQKLDIRLFEYDEIIQDGVDRKLLKKDGSFSELGSKEYKNITSLKDKYDYESYWSDNFENPNDVFYLPKIFNGRT